MDPITMSAIMAGVGGLNEMTTGQEQQRRDARLKAMAYRMSPYMRINPEDFKVRVAEPVGTAIAMGGKGYQMGSGMQRDKIMGDYYKAATAADLKKAGMEPQIDNDHVPTGVAPITDGEWEDGVIRMNSEELPASNREPGRNPAGNPYAMKRRSLNGWMVG